LLKKLQD